MGWVARALAMLVCVGTLAACTQHPVAADLDRSSTPQTRRPAHIVVVVMENRSDSQIVHNRNAPYLNTLLAQSANYSDFHAETHPSQPNYLALVSGSTHQVRSDSCDYRFRTDNLGDEVLDAGLTFTAYTESLPVDGVQPCADLGAEYTRAREPWTDFGDVPGVLNQTFSTFPHDYAKLPVLSFVIPNLRDSMHSGSVARGDRGRPPR